MKQVNTKSVGLFVLLPAPLNPIGAFDAESFKADYRSVVESNADAKFIGVDLSGLDFVYSDAYNAFMQIHQELSSRNGAFAVLADKESLANSLKKVGLERFIRIFMSEESMAAYQPVDAPKLTINPPKNETAPSDHAPAASEPEKVAETVVETVAKPVAEKPTEPVVEKPAEPAPQNTLEPRILETNPLVDETPSSKGAVVVVIILILIAVVAVSYFVL